MGLQTSCPTLCDPMNRSTPGLPVYHQLPEFTQTHPRDTRHVSGAFEGCGLMEKETRVRGILWRWRGPSGLRWVWRNGRGPHLDAHWKKPQWGLPPSPRSGFHPTSSAAFPPSSLYLARCPGSPSCSILSLWSPSLCAQKDGRDWVSQKERAAPSEIIPS